MGDLAKCPVSGVVFDVREDHPTIAHVDKEYFVCCDGCAAMFTATPAKYTSNLSEV